MTRKRQLLSNYIRLRIRLRGKQQLALSGVPDLMELAATHLQAVQTPIRFPSLKAKKARKKMELYESLVYASP